MITSGASRHWHVLLRQFPAPAHTLRGNIPGPARVRKGVGKRLVSVCPKLGDDADPQLDRSPNNPCGPMPWVPFWVCDPVFRPREPHRTESSPAAGPSEQPRIMECRKTYNRCLQDDHI